MPRMPPASENPDPERRRSAAGVLAGAIAVAGLAVWVYWPVRDHAFLHFDDRSFVVENAGLAAGLTADGLRYAWTSTTDGNWMPLTWLSFQLDREIHDLSPSGTHVTNLALHALASAALLVALFQLTGAAVPSAFVAAVFALHPLHVESVAWAIERKDVLSALWFHLLLLAWALYAKRPGAGRYAVAGACLVLGLLSKPMLVTAPFVLLLLDYWPLDRLRNGADLRRAVLEKLPMLVLVAGVAAVTVVGQRAAGAVKDVDVVPFAARLANAVASYAVYLRKALWPSDLAVYYPHPHDLGGVPVAQLAAGALLLVAASAIALWQARRRPHLLVGWLWYVGMLVPVIGIVQVGSQGMADRYTYLPLTGIALAVAFEIAGRCRSRPMAARVAAATAAVAVLVLAAAARQQIHHWRDDLSLFRQVVRVEERSAVGHNGLAIALLERGRRDDAIAHLRRATALDPDHVDAQVNLGVALVEAGRHESALPHLERGLGLPPERRWRVHANLGLAQAGAGRTEAAIRHYEQALALHARSAETWLNLAAQLAVRERWPEARRAFERAERLGVDAPGIHVLGAQIEQHNGRLGAAVTRYRRALEVEPDSLPALNNLAWLLASEPAVARPREAVALAERASRIAGGSEPSILDTLAVAYAAAGRRDDAARTASRAAELARARGDEALARAIEARSVGP